MPVDIIDELQTKLDALKNASAGLKAFLDGLNKTTIIKLKGIDRCDPIIINPDPDPPDVGRICGGNTKFVPGTVRVTVGDFHRSLERIDEWIRDIHEVASGCESIESQGE
jgi:hypothetical protein